MTTGENMTELARRIRARREEMGLSLLDVRDRGGPPPATVSRLERGLSSLTVPNLVRLAAALETEPGTLLEGLEVAP